MRLALDVRSKIILALFLVGGVAVLVTGLIGYRSGREALTGRIEAQLTSLVATTGQQTEAYFRNQTGQAAALSRDLMVIEAARDFRAAVAALPGEGGQDARTALLARYEAGFRSGAGAQEERVTEAYLPTTPQGLRLQYAYVLREDDAAGYAAPAPYQSVHDRYHDAMSAIAEDGGYEDVFLVSPDGFVLYTVLKEADFATSLTDGPYAQTGLADAFRAARADRQRGGVHVADYGFYEPSGGVPAAFVATPLYDGGQLVGVLALQLSDAEIDAIANQGGRWREAGLGERGEVFLVGADTRLRTIPRFYAENPEAFLSMTRAQGAEAGLIAQIEANESPVLLQTATSPAVTDAVQGRAGVQVVPADYAGEPALSASAPLDLPGLDWVVVAEMPLSEAYAPIRTFQRRLVIAAASLTVGLTVLAMILAALFMAPIRRLIARSRQVAGGALATPVALQRNDEFGELSREMQALVDSLRERSDTARAMLHRAEGVLGRFLPDGAVRVLTKRIEAAGDEEQSYTLSEPIPALSVVVLHLRGHEKAVEALPPEEAVATLDALVEEIASVGARHGVEEVRFTSDRYMAAAGLSSPVLDHERRAVAFARDALVAVARFAQRRDLGIHASAGVASGPDIMGVLGQNRLSFGLWGQTAAAAKAQAARAGDDEVAMTPDVRAAVDEGAREAAE